MNHWFWCKILPVRLSCDCHFLSVAMILTVLLYQSVDRYDSTTTDFSNVQIRPIIAMQLTGDKRRIYWGHFEADCTILCQEHSEMQLCCLKVLLFAVTWLTNKQDGGGNRTPCSGCINTIYQICPVNDGYFVYFLCYPKMTNSSETKEQVVTINCSCNWWRPAVYFIYRRFIAKGKLNHSFINPVLFRTDTWSVALL